MNKIFIQIASYRDPQLNPTIKSCLDNAKQPENLVFGICNQYHPEDEFNVDQYRGDERFRITDVLYSDATGVCAARHAVQQLYDGETYTLQIDSHMRFAHNWDVEFIEMIKQLQDKGIKKPLLTGYVSSFNPDNDPNERVVDPWEMAFDRYTPEGVVFFLPQTIQGWTTLTEPVPSRFYSAHFCFTLGVFSQEVQHDPSYYFHGEEISIAARAYTHGYDLFHPHKTLIWHEYTRKNRTKHWDDAPDWGKRNENCHLRNRKLFSMDGEVYDPEEFGIYGFGSERTLKDYEKYSGLLFSKRAVQQYTLDKKYPPNPQVFETEEEWLDSYASIFRHCIDVHFNLVPEGDYDFWVVAFHDEKDETLYRRDADINEINMMMKDPDGYCKIWRQFQTAHKPKYWVVWPHSTSKGWCERITGNL